MIVFARLRLFESKLLTLSDSQGILAITNVADHIGDTVRIQPVPHGLRVVQARNAVDGCMLTRIELLV